jgi:hypothetical protein
MAALIGSFDLTDGHVDQMQREGVIFLEQFFTPKALRMLEAAASTLTVPPDEERRRSFKRLAYGDGPPSQIVRDLCQSDTFVQSLSRLIGPHQVVTNLLSFELTPDKKGEEWHFGRRSFCFIGPDVPAYTLWIPLTPVKERAQGGGLVWVPQSVWSAHGRIQQWTLFYQMLAEGKNNITFARAQRKQFGVDGDPWAGPFDLALLEANKIEQDFNPGDALLFSRNVWHRTSQLRSPTLPGRHAIVIRFADGRAFLDKKIVAGFASVLRPVVDTFTSALLEADDTKPISEQEFSTRFSEMAVSA